MGIFMARAKSWIITCKFTVFALTVAMVLILASALSGCTESSPGAAGGPQPVFSGQIYEQTMQAMSEKDAEALPVSVVMNAYAVPGGNVPLWSYLFASQKYAKFYTVFNYSTKAVASIYGGTTWNADDWAAAPKEIPSSVQVDADKAYKSILSSYPAYADRPYRVSFLSYEPEIEKTGDAPSPLTWYFYFTTKDALDKFDSSVEHPDDIADSVIIVDAQTGEVSQEK